MPVNCWAHSTAAESTAHSNGWAGVKGVKGDTDHADFGSFEYTDFFINISAHAHGGPCPCVCTCLSLSLGPLSTQAKKSCPTWLQSHLQTSFWIRDIDERKKVSDFLFVDWNPNIFSLGHSCVTGVVRCTVRGAW